MSREISKAEGWEKVYGAFEDITFSSFDFDTVKRSIVDYMKLYFPESFNDFIESPEFVAIMETFAYMAELVSYRLDVNAHENFITLADRKQSVLRACRLVSYTPSRNLPARGLVKLDSISTTEDLFDDTNTSLTGKIVNWNDQTNPAWKEQFLIILNSLLEQEIGTVLPSDRIQVDNILFELYAANNQPLGNGVIPYGATAGGQSISMELTSGAIDGFGPYESRPGSSKSFNFLFGSDGLGDSSDATGFFIFTKQGSLAKISTTFDGVTADMTFDVEVEDINEIDVWVNQVDPDTREILDDGTGGIHKSGEWQQVSTVNGQSTTLSTAAGRQQYEIQTLDNDQIRLVFGDGLTSEIPRGSFDIWYRTSNNKDIAVQRGSVVNQSGSITYNDIKSNPQTISFTFSLVGDLNNSSASETVDHIRQTASAVYTTQDRMVSGSDYNKFMTQDPSILKLRSINRTFAGDSKYLPWWSENTRYEQVNIFGDDGLIYFRDTEISEDVYSELTGLGFLTDYVEPLLGSVDLYLRQIELAQMFNANVQINKIFEVGEFYDPKEKELILEAMGVPTEYNSTPPDGNFPLGLNFDVNTDNGIWVPTFPANDESMFVINQYKSGDTIIGWGYVLRGRRLVMHSADTEFWFNSKSGSVIDYDKIYDDPDTITILKENTSGIVPVCELSEFDLSFNIIGGEIDDNGINNASELAILYDIKKEDTTSNVLDKLITNFDLSNEISFTGKHIVASISNVGVTRFKAQPQVFTPIDIVSSVNFANGFYLVGGLHNNLGAIAYSTDGSNYNIVTLGSETGRIIGIEYINGNWAAIASPGFRAYTSPDAINWVQTTSTPNPSNVNAYFVEYVPSLNAIITGGVSECWHTFDGINWVDTPGLSNSAWKGVTYDNITVIIYGDNGYAYKASNDINNWVSYYPGLDYVSRRAGYSMNGVTILGSVTAVLEYSLDNTLSNNWTIDASALSDLATGVTFMVYLPTESLWYAVDDIGTWVQSVDGINNWTTATPTQFTNKGYVLDYHEIDNETWMMAQGDKLTITI